MQLALHAQRPLEESPDLGGAQLSVPQRFTKTSCSPLAAGGFRKMLADKRLAATLNCAALLDGAGDGVV